MWNVSVPEEGEDPAKREGEGTATDIKCGRKRNLRKGSEKVV